MLSPGDFHLRVPRDYAANLAYRLKLWKTCREQPKFRQACMDMCARDILFYINSFVYQFNPKIQGRGRIGPFLTWDFQEAALLACPDKPYTVDIHGLKYPITKGILWCYENNRAAVVEKSREMGASWLFLIVQDWLCLFHEYTQTLNMSRSAEAVEHKSPDSLFWKLRFMHQYLPSWMTGKIDDTKFFFGFPKTNSFITGQASTGKTGVGGRAAVMFIDEFQLIDEAIEVRTRTSGTTDCRFFNGTHLGPTTEFAKLCDPDQSPHVVKIMMHWTQHPYKNKGLYRSGAGPKGYEIIDTSYDFPADYQFVTTGSPTGGPFPGIRSPWYDWKSLDIGNHRGVAMELDIDPKGSMSQFFDALSIASLRRKAAGRPIFWRGDLEYDRQRAQPYRLRESKDGMIRMWMHPTWDGKVPFGKYSAGCDVSTGKGATPSCLTIANAMTCEKVLEFAHAWLEPKPFAMLAVAMCRMFHDAKLCWETPGPGYTMGEAVIETGYRNFWYNADETKVDWSATSAERPGWQSSVTSKRMLLEEYRDALQSEKFTNWSEIALEECSSFKYGKDGRTIEHSAEREIDDPSGARDNHGDRVIADALCWKMIREMGLDTQEKREEVQPVREGSLLWRRQYHERARRDEEVWS